MIRRVFFDIIILTILIILIVHYGLGGILIKAGKFLENSGEKIEKIGKSIKEKEDEITKIFKWGEK
jgi:hypothetical protein